MANILIAEHNATTSDYLANALKKSGNAVDVVDNCLDVWRLSDKKYFDILLIDIVMPGIDSFVLAQRAIQENPDLQVIFITGFAAVALDIYATPAHAPVPITTRPFHLKDIAARVRSLLGQGDWSGESEGTFGMAPENADHKVIYADFSTRTQAQA